VIDLAPDVVERVIAGLYDRLEADPVLTRLFGRKKPEERERVTRFFVEQFGGPASTEVVDVGMQRRHEHKVIAADEAERWLAHFADSLAEQGVAPDEVIAVLRPVALRVANPGLSSKEIRDAVDAAAKGDLTAVQAAVAQDPAALHQRARERTLLWAAAWRGRADVVAWLLANGASPGDRGSAEHATGVLVSALAVAKGDAAGLLADAGAELDQFDLACLGRTDELADVVHIDATCPDDDLVPLTPLHYAVDGGRLDTARWLIDQGAAVTPHSRRLLTTAARRGSLPLVELLLARGGDATQAEHLGPLGEDRAIAEALLSAGLDVDRPPRGRETFLTMACRADKGKRIEVVEALLALGADPHLADGFGTTAVEMAERAGFTEALARFRRR
jgi:truncated hemoglobin YjbI/ankyrin repeat protein